jgi:hypothetical protein
MDRRSLYTYLKENNFQLNSPEIQSKLFSFVQEKKGDVTVPDNSHEIIHNFVMQLQKKWQSANRTRNVFESKNESWLDGIIFHVPPSNENKGGRPSKNFEDAATRTKDKKVAEIVEKYSSHELLYASAKRLKRDQKFKEAKIVKQIQKNEAITIGTYSKEKALALLTDAELSKSNYQLLRNSAMEMNCPLYPPYNDVKLAKLDCYPQNITTTDFSANIPLLDLLHHTVSRLLLSQVDVIQTFSNISHGLNMHYKIGFDGSTCQSIYKQVAENERDLASEQSLFMTCIVPLQLYFFKDGKRQIVWQNPKPSSTLYCRPLRFVFQKENTDAIMTEFNTIQEEIKETPPTEVSMCGTTYTIINTIDLTMIDGKVHTVISNATSSSQSCSICGASPTEMNKMDIIESKVVQADIQNLKFGISTLHAWIRFLELVLHIAYRLPFKNWQARGDDAKSAVSNEKSRIQKDFREQMGLVIDQPRSGGAGTSNDGNTARRVFQDTEIASNILNIDKALLDNFHTILATMSCGFHIDTLKFHKFCRETAELYVSLYSWYPMSQTVHKILFHGADVIDALALPLGMMSEEAQETSNKLFRRYREKNTRKMNRKLTNLDLVHKLLCTSDPYISSMRKPSNSKRMPLPSKVVKLLKDPSAIVDI